MSDIMPTLCRNAETMTVKEEFNIGMLNTVQSCAPVKKKRLQTSSTNTDNRKTKDALTNTSKQRLKTYQHTCTNTYSMKMQDAQTCTMTQTNTALSDDNSLVENLAPTLKIRKISLNIVNDPKKKTNISSPNNNNIELCTNSKKNQWNK